MAGDLQNYQLYDRVSFHRGATGGAVQAGPYVPYTPPTEAAAIIKTEPNERRLPPPSSSEQTTPPSGYTGSYDYTGNEWLWVPATKGGVQFVGSPEVTDLETEHQSAGTKYSSTDRRNAEERTLTTYLWQQHTGFFFDAMLFVGKDGVPPYWVAEQYWVTAQGELAIFDTAGLQHAGRALQGIVANTFSFSIDRQAGGVLEMSCGGFLNADRGVSVGDVGNIPAELYDLTGLAPNLGLPEDNPQSMTATLIDFAVAAADGEDPPAGWDRGDDEQIRSLTFTYTHSTAPDVFRASLDAGLDQSWTKINRGNPTLELGMTYVINETDVLDWHRGKDRRKCKARIVGQGRAPDAQLTTVVPAGDNWDGTAGEARQVQFPAPGSDPGFKVGQVVLVGRPGGSFDVMYVSAADWATDVLTMSLINVNDFWDLSYDAATGSSFRFAASDGDAIEIQNAAWMIEIPLAEITSPGVPEVADLVYVVNMTIGARLLAGQEDLVQYLAYNAD